jgi:ABC-2 type transport system ATP-binding protein
MEKALVVDKISKDYFGKQVLSEISFTVSKGAIHGLLGPNGAGKSTTMKIIAGLLRPQSGQVNWPHDRSRCAILTEGLSLYSELTVTEFLTYMGKLYGITQDQIFHEVSHVIKMFHLSSVEKKLINQLSKGFKQRLGIASILIHKPEFIILDEPTVGLDPQTVIELREMILKLKDSHTILISSHSLHDMSLLCDEVTILHHGKVQASGNVKDIEKLFKKENLIICHVKKTPIEKVQAIKIQNLKLKELKEGQDYELIFENQSQEDLRPILVQYLIQNGFELLALEEKHNNLEEIFFQATGREE